MIGSVVIPRFQSFAPVTRARDQCVWNKIVTSRFTKFGHGIVKLGLNFVLRQFHAFSGCETMKRQLGVNQRFQSTTHKSNAGFRIPLR